MDNIIINYVPHRGVEYILGTSAWRSDGAISMQHSIITLTRYSWQWWTCSREGLSTLLMILEANILRIATRCLEPPDKRNIRGQDLMCYPSLVLSFFWSTQSALDKDPSGGMVGVWHAKDLYFLLSVGNRQSTANNTQKPVLIDDRILFCHGALESQIRLGSHFPEQQLLSKYPLLVVCHLGKGYVIKRDEWLGLEYLVNQWMFGVAIICFYTPLLVYALQDLLVWKIKEYWRLTRRSNLWTLLKVQIISWRQLIHLEKKRNRFA